MTSSVREGGESPEAHSLQVKEDLIAEGFGAVLEGDYGRAYDVLSTEINQDTGRSRRDYTNPNYLVNIVAREESYDKLPEHIGALVQGEDQNLYDLDVVEPKVREFAEDILD